MIKLQDIQTNLRLLELDVVANHISLQTETKNTGKIILDEGIECQILNSEKKIAHQYLIIGMDNFGILGISPIGEEEYISFKRFVSLAELLVVLQEIEAEIKKKVVL